jgi:GT2 family glycosyltransferase
MPCSRLTTPLRTPRRRKSGPEVMTLDHEPANAGAPDTPQVRWLAWDGRTLHWHVRAAAPVSIELQIDGVRFATFGVEPADSGQHFTCAFELSPTGCAQLEFAIAVAGAAQAPVTAWRVLFGSPAHDHSAQWDQAPRRLLPLAGTPQLPVRAWPDMPPLAIVIPVFNAAASVRRCLEALARFTPLSVRVILIDDASTDPAIAGLLERFAQRDHVQVARHDINRGYTRGVNTGMQLAGNADVILLNSDTEVGPRWLESLRLAAYSEETIGTVTAVSDNAGAFSVPELEQFCPIPERWDLPTAQRAVLQQAGLRFPELPTGNGFCLFIKRALIERIGMMDADAFPYGYGEENDFCQRALIAGFRNVIAGHVLVRHERSASFGDSRRAALGQQGMAVLRQRYPRYEADVGATLYSFERRVLDYRVRRTYAGSDGRYAPAPPRPRILRAAGTGEAADNDARWNGHEVFVLLQHDGQLRLQRTPSGGDTVTEAEHAGAHTELERVQCLARWLLAFAIECVQTPAPDALGNLVLHAASLLAIPVIRGPGELPGT